MRRLSGWKAEEQRGRGRAALIPAAVPGRRMRAEQYVSAGRYTKRILILSILNLLFTSILMMTAIRLAGISQRTLTGCQARVSGPQISWKDNFICEVEGASEIPLGALVVVEGTFSPFSQARSPGEFDQEAYYRTLKIGGRLKKASLLQMGEEYWHIREGLFGLKLYFRERLVQIFPPREAALMGALLLGEKEGLDGELKDLYRRSGILHILSISSLHITILGMSVYRLLRRLGIPVGPAAAAGSVLLVLYGTMVGFSVSACRAIGMYLIRMLGEVAGRTYDMLTALGVMAAVMVAGNPFYLRSSGFLLSFGSVLGLGVVCPALFPERPRKPRGAGNAATGSPVRKSRNTAGSGHMGIFRKAAAGSSGKPSFWEWVQGAVLDKIRSLPEKAAVALGQSLRASISITLATLPIQLWFYYEVPTYSVFLNLLVIPLVKPLMILGLAAMGVPGLGFLAGVDCLILGGYEFLCGCFDCRSGPGIPAARSCGRWPSIIWCCGRPRDSGCGAKEKVRAIRDR